MNIDQVATHLIKQLHNVIYFWDVELELTVDSSDIRGNGDVQVASDTNSQSSTHQQKVPLVTYIDQLNDPIYRELFLKIIDLLTIIKESDHFIDNLSRGNLTVKPPKNNLIVSSFKQLHANLNHLVWQVQRISEGDLTQKIDFLGDFSLYFNKLISSLKERERFQRELLESKERLHQLNIELEEANKTKDKFISLLGHDLRNPFNALMGFSQALLDNYDNYDKEAIRPYIEIINNTSRKTYNLLEELLEWATAKEGQIRVDFQPVFLSVNLNDCINLYSETIEDKNLTVVNKIPTELCCYCDENLMKTICRNFLTNAIKFSHPGDTITISSKNLTHKMAEITFSDNGVGMDAETLDSLFKIDRTLTRVGTKGERGAGFGLLLAKEMVENQGGTISVQSKEGEGSHFSFTIPLYDPV